MKYTLIIVSVSLGAVGQVLLKLGTSRVVVTSTASVGNTLDSLVRYLINVWILVGLGCYALSAVVWIFAIAKVNLSIAYPMVAVGYIIVIILSFVIFKEPVSGLRLLGLGVIILGVLIISRS